VSQGVQLLHTLGLGHGDLKLDNILVTEVTQSQAVFSRRPRIPVPGWLEDQIKRDSGLQVAIRDLQNGLLPSHFRLFDFGKANKLEVKKEAQNDLTRKEVDAFMWTMTVLQLRHATDELKDQMPMLNGRVFVRQMDETRFDNLVETLSLGMWENVDNLLSNVGIQTFVDQSVQGERPRKIMMRSLDRQAVISDVEELPANWWYQGEHPVILTPHNPYGTPDGRRLARPKWCKKIMTDFNIDAKFPTNSYLFYRQPDVISFMDLFEAVTGIDTPTPVRNFIDYFLPKLGPVLIMFSFANGWPQIKLQAVIQWGSTAAMGDFFFSVGKLRLEIEFVMKASCLGIEFCGCTGLKVMMSSFPDAKAIAYRTYDSVVKKIKDEFPDWTPPFTRNQMGPSVSLTAGLGVTNQLSGQAQGYLSIMNVQIMFLPRLDVAFQIGTSRMYFEASFTLNAFGAQCGVAFKFDLGFSPFKLYFEKRIFWDFGRLVFNLLPSFLRKVLDHIGISFSSPGGLLIGGGTTGFKFGFTIFGWSFELGISFGRIRRKLQERNQTFLAKLESFDSRMTPHTLLVKLNSLNNSKSGNPSVAKPQEDGWNYIETLESLLAQNPCHIPVLISHVPRFKRLTEEPFKDEDDLEVDWKQVLTQRMTEKVESDPKYQEQYELCYVQKELPEVFRANFQEEQSEDIILLLLQEGVNPSSITKAWEFEMDILPDLYEIAFGHKMVRGRRLSDCILGQIINAIGEFISDPMAALNKMVNKLKDAICNFVGAICDLIRCLANPCDCIWCPSLPSW
jgi:hypothetical protein